MQIPSQFSMVRVDGSEPPTSDPADRSGWWQHHRSEDVHVGCVTRCHRKGTPTLQTWYCDYIFGSTFNTLQEMQRAALVVSEAEVAKLLSQYPQLSTVEALDEPAKGHSKPRCSFYPNESASHVAVLIRSWNNDWNKTVFLGAKAMGRVKKKESAAWMITRLVELKGAL